MRKSSSRFVNAHRKRLPPLESAWLAGFYEGEGSTVFSCGQNSYQNFGQLRFLLTQVEKEPLDRVAKMLEVKVLGPYKMKRKNNQDIYRVQIANFETIQNAVCHMWPFLSKKRRTQIAKAFKAYYSYKNRTHELFKD